ncbi:MAG: thioredoxin-like domain-containing protein [Chloroflexota bacterium]
MNLRPALALRLLIPLLLLVAVAAACSGGGGDSLSSPTGSPDLTAPEFPAGQTWFNVSRPLTMQELRGKVVVLDFWTLGCINCQHIIPDLTKLEAEFGDAVAVIGVHSGKYDREHADDSVREAVLRLGLDHPVINDPDFTIWNEYGANAWPTIVVIDPAGQVIGAHEGEGVYDGVEPAIKQLVTDFDAKGEVTRTPLPIDLEAAPIATDFLSFPGTVLAEPVSGRLFIADSDNNRILISSLDGALQKSIGSGKQGFLDGTSAAAEFNQPQGLALSADGDTLYVADTRNHAVRTVDLATGDVKTLAGNGTRAQDVPAAGAGGSSVDLASPWGLQLVGNTLYVAMAGTHQIWQIDVTTGVTQTFLGSGQEGIAEGKPAEAKLAQPNQITINDSTLYWVDPESSGVRSYALTGGDVKTIAGSGLFDFGDQDGAKGDAKLQHPQGIAFANGTLYVADTYNHKIKTVDPNTGDVKTVAGTGAAGDADGNGTAASLDEPGGLSVANGSLYIADTNNNAIRVFDLATGDLSTLQLSNLAVAAAGQQGRTLKESLDPITINSSTTTLRVRFAVPDGYQLNNLAPSDLKLTTSNATAFAPQQADVMFTSSDVFVEVSVPVTAASGQAILSAAGQVYYCRENENAICLVDQVDIALPVTISDGAPAGDAVLSYTLPK